MKPHKGKKWVLLSEIVFLCLMIFHVNFVVAETLFTLENNGERQVSLVTGSKYYPYIDESLPNYGWSNAVVFAVFQHLSIKVNIEHFPWARVEYYTKQGIYDGSFPFIFTKQRSVDFHYSDAINYVEVQILARKNLNIPSFSSLAQYRFCLPYGYEITSGFRQVISVKNLTRAPKTADCINKVNAGWSDVVLVNKYSKEKILIDEMPLKVLMFAVPKEPLYFIVAKSHPQGEKIINTFNQALKEIKANRKLEEINAKYEQMLLRKIADESML